MKRTLLFVALAALVASTTSCGITTIPPGYEGIKVNNVGSRRGVEDYPVLTGRIIFNPINESVYDYPTFQHQYVWTASSNEGKSTDESFTFNSVEGTTVNADIGIVLNVIPGTTPHLFVTYRQDMDHMIDGIIHNEVRKYLGEEGGKLRVMDIIGPGKAKLCDAVRADLKSSELGKYFNFVTVSFVSNPRVPQQVQEAINSVNTAASVAAAAIAKANAVVNAARGDSAAAVIRAMGEAEANDRVQRSLTPALIEYVKANKWNGSLPYVTGGGALPLINLPK